MWYGKCLNERCPQPSDFRASQSGPVFALFYCTGCGKTYRLSITGKDAQPVFEEFQSQRLDNQKVK